MVAASKTRFRNKPQALTAHFACQNPAPADPSACTPSQPLQRARCYDPSTGEFTSRDPLEYVDGMSVYRGYLLIAGIDPEGTVCVCHCEVTDFTNGPSRRTYHQFMLGPGITKDEARLRCDRICTRNNRKYKGSYSSKFHALEGCEANATLTSYGKYCGPLRKVPITSCCHDAAILEKVEPIDELDLACAHHDCCVAIKEKWFDRSHHFFCNRQFCSRLFDVDCNRSFNPRICRTYRFDAMVLVCGLNALGIWPLP